SKPPPTSASKARYRHPKSFTPILWRKPGLRRYGRGVQIDTPGRRLIPFSAAVIDYLSAILIFIPRKG
ncbi:MAG: hypothetical protein AAGH42_13180, partial [Pseudomonadota bacterium]